MNKAILTHRIKKEDENKTVEFICRKRLNMSAGVLTETKLKGGIILNGNVCITTDTVTEGDILTADVTESTPSASVEASKIQIKARAITEIPCQTGFHIIGKLKGNSIKSIQLTALIKTQPEYALLQRTVSHILLYRQALLIRNIWQ